MSSESPAAVLFDFNGNELAVQNATAIPASTPALIFAGSDGTNSRYITVDASGRQIIVGAAAAGGAPVGNPVYVAGKNSAGNLTAVISDFLGSPISSIGANMAAVQSNATVTTSGSTIISTNDFGTQQISLVINVTAAPTGTTPTITYTIQEVDPGNITTVFGNSTTSSAINSISVNSITLTSTTSNTIKVSWTVTGTTPSFTGVYTTLVTKATPTTQPISGTISVSGTVGVTQSTSPWVDNISQFGGSNVVTGTGASGAGIPRVTVSNDSNILATQSGSWTVTATQATPANLRTQTASEATTATSTGTVAALVGGAVTTASPTYTTGQMDPLSLTTAGALRVDGSAVTQPVSGTVTANQGTANTLANAWSTKITDATNGPVAVKAASTAAAAADPSLVTAFSPNSPLPTGSNVIGALTANQSVNVAQIAGSATSTAASGVQKVGVVGGTGTSLETTAGVLDHNLKNIGNSAVATLAAGEQKVAVEGLAASGSATSGNPVLVAGADPLNVHTLLTDTNGRQIVVGAAASGGAVTGNPVYVAGKNPSGNAAPFITDADNSIIASIGGNQATVQSNATVTTTGSSIITTNDFGAQQISLIINITAAPTGTTPTITYTLQEIDPGNGTTVMGNSSSSTALSTTGVTIVTLTSTTSNVLKVSWTVTGTTPSFTGVYTTIVSKATPTTQQTSTASTSSTTGLAIGVVALGGGTTGSLNPIRATTYNEQTTGAQRSLSSASTADTSAGTGAQQVTITYFDSSGNGPNTETVTLNGTTAVNTVNTNICFIEKMVVTRSGSGGVNAGVITLFVGTAGAGGTLGTIGTGNIVAGTGDNRTLWAHHYVANGKTASFSTFIAAANTNSGANFLLKSKNPTSATATEVIISDIIVTSNYSIVRDLTIPIKVAGPARVLAYGIPGANSLVLTTSFDFSEQ